MLIIHSNIDNNLKILHKANKEQRLELCIYGSFKKDGQHISIDKVNSDANPIYDEIVKSREKINT